jgi:hypothetical protein
MKQSVSPVVFFVAIVAVAAIACFVGFRALFPPRNNMNPSVYQNRMRQATAAQTSTLAQHSAESGSGSRQMTEQDRQMQLQMQRHAGGR